MIMHDWAKTDCWAAKNDQKQTQQTSNTGNSTMGMHA